MPIDADLVFHALADATRRDILNRTLREDLSVSQIARAYPMRHSAVQKHVKVLENAGLLRGRRSGRELLMSGDPKMLRASARRLEQLADQWHDRLTAMDRLLAQDDEPSTEESANDA